MTRQKISLSTILLFITGVAVPGFVTGCFTADTYHNKRHLDTMRKDMNAAHKDIDRVLGLDEPSPLVEEK